MTEIGPAKVPTITSAAVPRPAVPPPPTTPRVNTEGTDPNIIAKPLVTPGFTEVISKNPNLSFRWCNRSAGHTTGNEGMQVDSWLAAGFRVATASDCEIKGLSLQNGKFIKGDLMLLCIARADYEGALKYNRQNAIRRIQPDKTRAAGRAELARHIRESGMATPPDLSKKLQVFNPSDAQVAGLVGTDASESTPL